MGSPNNDDELRHDAVTLAARLLADHHGRCTVYRKDGETVLAYGPNVAFTAEADRMALAGFAIVYGVRAISDRSTAREREAARRAGGGEAIAPAPARTLVEDVAEELERISAGLDSDDGYPIKAELNGIRKTLAVATTAIAAVADALGGRRG